MPYRPTFTDAELSLCCARSASGGNTFTNARRRLLQLQAQCPRRHLQNSMIPDNLSETSDPVFIGSNASPQEMISDLAYACAFSVVRLSVRVCERFAAFTLHGLHPCWTGPYGHRFPHRFSQCSQRDWHATSSQSHFPIIEVRKLNHTISTPRLRDSLAIKTKSMRSLKSANTKTRRVPFKHG